MVNSDLLIKNENENEEQYIWRVGQLIDQNKFENFKDIVHIINEQLREDETKYRDESAYRKKYQIAKLMYDNVFSKFESDTYSKEIQIQKDELFKLKKQYQDQKREYNKILTSDARADHLSEMLVESANKLNIERPLVFNDVVEADKKREAVLFLADWHYGMVTDNIWNKYNTEICRQRVEKLCNKTIEYLLLNNVDKINIVLLGDECHGGIHNSARVKSEEDVCDQLMQVSEIIAEFVGKISSKVNKVDLYSTYGNHMRTIQDKHDSIHSDNMEKIIPWWLEQRLRDNKKVEIKYSEFKEFTKLEVKGYKICCVHGDLDGIKNLGVTVNTIFSRLFDETIDYTVSADKHHLEEFEKFDIENILVRSLCGTDDYANDKRLYSKAGQTLMIFTEEDGRESTYNIKLN